MLSIIIIFIFGVFIFRYRGYRKLKNKINLIISVEKENLNQNSQRTSLNLETTSGILGNKNKDDKNKEKNKKKENQKSKKDKKDKHSPPIKNKAKRKSAYKKNNFNLGVNEDNSSAKRIKKQNIKEIKIKKEIEQKENSLSNIKVSDNSKINFSNLQSKTHIKKPKKLKLNDFELNTLEYKEALKIDKRTYIQYYLSLLKIGNFLLFSFLPNNDYNSKILKICLFFFSFGLYFTVNALFFTDSTMNKIYEDEGIYDFINQIPKLLYSNIICTVINIIAKTLSLSEKDILKLKDNKQGENLDKKAKIIKKRLLIKIILFYIVGFLFLFIFWFYVATFCAVYYNTQLYLIKDTLISFGSSLIYPFGYYLVPGILRIPSLKSKKKNKKCLYKICLLCQSI